MAKQLDEYAQPYYRTPRTAAFINWVESETDLKFRSEREKAAFEQGLVLGVRAYSLFQQAERIRREREAKEGKQATATPRKTVASRTRRVAAKATKATKPRARRTAAA